MLVLIRHGQSTGNAAGLLLGQSDLPLTELGREQAVAAGGLLSSLGPVHRLFTSPLSRAVETAALLGTALGAESDPRWIEVDYGEHEGRPLGEVPADVWVRWRADPSFRPAGGETLTEVQRRVAVACEELFAVDGEGARDPGGHVVVVSHVSPIKAAVSWALAADATLAWRLYLATGSMTTIGWGSSGPVLRSFNEIPRLRPLADEGGGRA